MSKPLKPRRGTTAEQNAFVGEAYEITYDTDKNTLVCRDGVTPGGFPLAKEADVQTLEAKDAEQDTLIEEALNRMSMPIGIVFPYTGKEVPAGTLRADGATYTNMRTAFPDFYNWVVASGLTVPLGSYALVEGSCGYYGLDESNGTVRMPTLAAGVFGADAASKYGQAVEAGLPEIAGRFKMRYPAPFTGGGGPFSVVFGAENEAALEVSGTDNTLDVWFNASRCNPIYGRSDTVTPSHVKYPWVIVVYNAAVPPSVAQAGEFIEMLDKLATALPAGTVVPHAGNKDLNGYLLCNGAAVSRTTYAKLFETIGTTYGAGDGSSTFNLPNLTDRFIQGSGTAGATKAAGLPNIAGYVTSVAMPGGGAVSGCFSTNSDIVHSVWSDGRAAYSKNLDFNASFSNSIYGASSTVQPPAVTMRYYIKY